MSWSLRTLLQRARWDIQAAAQLIRHYEPVLRRTVRAGLADPQFAAILDSLDICAAVLDDFFVQATEGALEFDRPEQLINVLATLVCNKVLARAHQQRARQQNGRALEHVSDESPLPLREVLDTNAPWRKRWGDRSLPPDPTPARAELDAPAAGLPLPWEPDDGTGLGGGRQRCRRRLAVALSIVVLLLAVGGIVLYLLPADRWGDKLTFGQMELYYGRGVTETEARSLGQFLRELGIGERRPATIRLSRTETPSRETVYQIDVFVKPALVSDEEFLAAFAELRAQMSHTLFGGRRVVIRLCDQYVDRSVFGQRREPRVLKVLGGSDGGP
jgi:hypothetical protein